MWIKLVFLAVMGISAGTAVAGGMFALLIALGIISRLTYRTGTARYILLYEHAVSLGAVVGGCYQIFPWRLPIGYFGLAVLGLCFGSFVGTWIMTLTEIIDTIPIFMRRTGLRTGLSLLIIAMALGHSAGMLLYVL